MDYQVKLIVKFLGKEANCKELEQLESLLKEEKTSALFDQFIQIHYLVILSMNHFDKENAKIELRKRIKKEILKRKRIFYSKIAAAASIAFLIGFYWIPSLNQDKAEVFPENEISADLQPGSDKAILTLDNGNQIIFEEGKQYTSQHATGNNKNLTYQVDKSNKHLVEYNYLTVPRGGRYQVQLCDGTRIWLNSDSKLKYPTGFSENQSRNVELLYGEAFFEVASSTPNEPYGPFIITTREQTSKVLGTQFNIKAYSDEQIITTTLVEGSLNVSTEMGGSQTLKPNQQSLIHDNQENIHIQTVDVDPHVAWMKGLFSFEDQSLEDIMNNLSRWYDAEVIFESFDKRNFLFTGTLKRSESVESILNHIASTSDGDLEYHIDKKTIVIK
ncbi:MAG: DUF4974 domain-containing protein [Flavobacteriaceae bacterium]|nr:DUF4974 domain-containing protein [Flavobacteriaceae bacterium]